jgi:membrane-associated phospholipid phosphatase
VFVFTGLLLLLGLAGLSWAWGYGQSFVWINSHTPHWLSQLSRMLTHLGDAWLVCSLILALVWRRSPGVAVAGLLGITVTGAVVQGLKNTVFSDWARPAGLFSSQPDVLAELFLAPEHAHCCFSFPSGHSSTVWATATALVFGIRVLNNQAAAQVIVAIGALAAGLTRVWVGAHFPLDVAVGGLLGLTLSLGCMIVFLESLQNHFAKNAWHLGPLGRGLGWLGWLSAGLWTVWITTQLIDY